jgi:hypothetical protein
MMAMSAKATPRCDASVLRCRLRAGSVVFMSAHTAPATTLSAASSNTDNATRALFTLKINPAVRTASASSMQVRTPGGAVATGS